MKLTDQEFKRYKELLTLIKSKKASKADQEEFAELDKKKKSKPGNDEFHPGNDFSWWNKHPELTRDSATFKSNYIAGQQISPGFITYVIPGVLEVALRSCYGPSVNPTDPVNIWARNTYLKMFQKYRPASGYGASDMGISILAGLEAVKLTAVYERIYGVINRYSVLNVNMPAVEATALGLSTTQVDYLQTHLSDFRYDLNMLIKRAQRLCIPKDISLVADAISLFGYEYIDHDNPRGQIIMFTLKNFGVYSDTNLSSGGSIQFQDDLVLNLFDFNADNMCKALDTVLNALLGSDSIQRIYADLTVWFGSENMLTFLPLPEDYIIVPVKSDSILHKVHNIECHAGVTGTGTPTLGTALTSFADLMLSSADQTAVLNGNYHVYQVDDRIVTVGVIKDTNSGTPTSISYEGRPGQVLAGTSNITGMGKAHMVDGYNIEVTPEFMVEGVLFKNWCDIQSGQKYALVRGCVAYLPHMLILHKNTSAVPYTASNWLPIGSAAQVAGQMALIDWAPLSYHVSGVDTIDEVYGDMDVVVPISVSDLTRLQRTCLLSGLTTELVVKS